MEWNTNRTVGAVVGFALLVSLAACESGPSAGAADKGQPGPLDGQPAFVADLECGTYAGDGCAREGERIDIDRPTFSNPTEITNPLFPISELESVVLLGEVDGLPFRSETTLLPDPGTVLLDGELVEVALSQYTAYLDGRITEVALDRYAQADDGSVWYLGEDVYDYDAGTITLSEGTWLAGRDGPAAMIMSGDPKVGQVFRPEDIPGIVFEEVTVTEVGKTVDGPFGPLDGALVGEELHLDGTVSEKIFAPGYGEFFSAHEGDVEALAVAVSPNRLPEPEPVELAQLISGTWGLVESARLEEWKAVEATLTRITESWAIVTEGSPTRIADNLDAALATLAAAVAEQQPGAVTDAAVEVAQSALDLKLQYRPVAVVDVERFHLHAQQLRIDAAADDAAGVAAEVATLEWIRDRVTGTLSADELQVVDDRLGQLRTTAGTGDLAAAADQAARLANLVRTLSLP